MIDREEIILRAGIILRKLNELVEEQAGQNRKPREDFAKEAAAINNAWRAIMEQMQAGDALAAEPEAVGDNPSQAMNLENQVRKLKQEVEVIEAQLLERNALIKELGSSLARVVHDQASPKHEAV
jgi:hypothetical protein